jgi:hypothetical protein
MEMAYFDGAMYVRLTGAEKLDKTPIHLGDGILKDGEYIQKMGEKKRTSFEMQGGWYLRYKGRYNDTLFFDTNTGQETSPYEWHYGFYYIDKNTLLIGGKSGMRDIRINHLEKHESVPLQKSEKQVSMF